VQKLQELHDALLTIPLLGPTIAYLESEVPTAIAKFQEVWNSFLEVLEAGRVFYEESLVPLFNVLVELFEVTLAVALEALAGLWQNVLLPAIEKVWTFIDQNVVPVFTALMELIRDKVMAEFDKLKTFVEVTLMVALGALVTMLSITLLEAWNTMMNALDKAKTAILDPLVNVFESVGEKVKFFIDRVAQLRDAIANLTLPDWLTPGSPTPFELGLGGINQQVAALAQAALPKLQAALNLSGGPLLGGLALGGRGAMSAGQINIINLESVSFPSVRDGRDASGFLREFLDEVTREAGVKSVVPGVT